MNGEEEEGRAPPVQEGGRLLQDWAASTESLQLVAPAQSPLLIPSSHPWIHHKDFLHI